MVGISGSNPDRSIQTIYPGVDKNSWVHKNTSFYFFVNVFLKVQGDDKNYVREFIRTVGSYSATQKLFWVKSLMFILMRLSIGED